MSDLSMVRIEDNHYIAGLRWIDRIVGLAPDVQNGREEGFTLFEVLVILLLLALMSVLSLTFLNQLSGFRGRNADFPYQAEADNAVRHIERTLESALPLPLDVDEPESQEFFVGGSQNIVLVTQSRVGLSEAVLRTVRIGLKSEGPDSSLVQSNTVRRADLGRQTEPSNDVEILPGVSELEFGYLLFDGAGSPVWAAEWTKEGLLPLAVSINLAIDRNGKRFTAAGSVRFQASKLVDYYFNCPNSETAFRLDELAERSRCRARLAASGRVPDFCSCEGPAR
jgi:hypothetical protein